MCSLACLNVAFSVVVTTFLYFFLFIYLFIFFLVASICWKSSFFVCVPRGTFFFFFFFIYVSLWEKIYEPRRWLTEVAVYFRGVV